MTRLRVLELIKSLDAGGAEMLLLHRMRARNSDEFDYEVAYLDPTRAGLVPALSAVGVHVSCLGAASVRSWSWVARLRRRLRAGGYDVVHVHSPLMAAGVRLAVRSLREPPVLVSTEHSVRHHPLTQWLDQATVRADDMVFAVSDAVAEAPVCRAAGSVETLHHGVDLDDMTSLVERSSTLARELGLDEGPRVVSVANFRPEKRHRDLLAAACRVRAAAPAVHFYVAGHGPEEHDIRGEVESRGMSDWYHVLGSVPGAARLTACADVFVLASEWEGRPVAVMEALACGVPVVATAVGGVPDMVQDGDNGLLVRPHDVQGLAAALVRALTDDELRARLAAGAVASRLEHDVSRAARRLEDAYVRLSAGERSKRRRSLLRGPA